MPDLSSQEIEIVGRQLAESEQASLQRSKFLERVSLELEARGYEGRLRGAVMDYARKLAETSDRLTSDLADLDEIFAAHRALRDCGVNLEQAAWKSIVSTNWPAPIAHEIDRLLEELKGRRLSTGERLPPSTDAVLLQLRDAIEALIKHTCVIVLQALSRVDRDNADWVAGRMFRRMELGAWIENLRDGVERAQRLTASLPEPIASLVRLAQVRLLPLANAYSPIRNNTIGHAAHALDANDTAEIVRGFLETGRVRDLRGKVASVPPLGKVLSEMANDGAFAGIELRAEIDGVDMSLVGSGATESWLKDPRHRDHAGVEAPIVAHLSTGEKLHLGPYIAARLCTQCARRDVLIYDSLYDRKRGGVFDLLDFARGHKSRLGSHEARDLSDALHARAPDGADAENLAGDSASYDYVLEALDKARIDRNYLSPSYLRADLVDFLAQIDRGVFWLQAPAHIGKTTFIQGLSDPERGDKPIDSRFDWERKGKVVAYFCRKEYRSGLGGMIAHLDRMLEKRYRGSDNVRSEQPNFRPVVDEGTPEAFVKWLQEWRMFAERKRIVETDAPLILAIDGLDEADPPNSSSPLQVLPAPSLLPAGIYLVLTSRPVGADDSPDFLKTHVEQLYGAA